MNMEINPSEYKVLIVDDVISNVLLLKVLLTNEKYGAQNEAYMSRSAEKWVRGLCFNELGVGG